MLDDLLRKRHDVPEREARPPPWMLDLERAHDRLRHAAQLLESNTQRSPTDLRPAARAIERVYEGIFDAFDERRPGLDATRAAREALDEAMALLSPAAPTDAAVGFALDHLRETRVALLEADDRLATVLVRAPAPAPDLRASQGMPALHILDRPSLKLRLRVPEAAPPEATESPQPIARPETFEELERAVNRLGERASTKRAAARDTAAEPPAARPDPPLGFAEDVGRALTRAEFVHQRVRECFEEVAMIGTQRAPLLGDPWRAAQLLERRMLASIDAIVAMGPHALEALEPLVVDAPLKDPSRLFALAMILGCVGGRDALAITERVFFALEPGDPGHAVQLGAALKLAPHPFVPLAMRRLLADADPTHRALAIDVLAYRGMATEPELARAAVDEPPVAAVALPWFGLSRDPSASEAIDAGLRSADACLRGAARLAMVLGGDRRAVPALRDALSSEGPEAENAAALLAIVAGAREAELLLERATGSPTRMLVSAVGWAGAPGAVPWLLGLLEHADEEVVLAAAYALDRITNAGLYEDAVVDDEEILAPDVPEPDVELGDPPAPALADIISDPHDTPAEPSTQTLRRPTTRADRWRAYWTDRAASYEGKARYRRGQPYSPLVSWRELDQFPCTPGERRMLQWELVARTGEHVRFDPHDFVPAQEAAIAEWEAAARRTSAQPGSWALPLRR